MNAKDRSCLVYLLGALQVAPKKAEALFIVALHPYHDGYEHGEDFYAAVRSLRDAPDLLKAVADMRQKLRTIRRTKPA